MWFQKVVSLDSLICNQSETLVKNLTNESLLCQVGKRNSHAVSFIFLQAKQFHAS